MPCEVTQGSTGVGQKAERGQSSARPRTFTAVVLGSKGGGRIGTLSKFRIGEFE